MNRSTFRLPQLVVSCAAANKLADLKKDLNCSLLFKVRRNKESRTSLTICHHHEAEGFIFEINGIGVAVSRSVLGEYLSLYIGVLNDKAGDGKHSFILTENDHMVCTLPIESARVQLRADLARLAEDEHGGLAQQMMG